MKRIAIATALVSALAVSVRVPAQTPPRVVVVEAKRFEFTPKEVVLAKGEPVTIRLHATDHAHGLLVKPLRIDLDAGEGETDEVTITPPESGTFLAICDDYCGAGHGNMKMTFVVVAGAPSPSSRLLRNFQYSCGFFAALQEQVPSLRRSEHLSAVR